MVSCASASGYALGLISAMVTVGVGVGELWGTTGEGEEEGREGGRRARSVGCGAKAIGYPGFRFVGSIVSAAEGGGVGGMCWYSRYSRGGTLAPRELNREGSARVITAAAATTASARRRRPPVEERAIGAFRPPAKIAKWVGCAPVFGLGLGRSFTACDVQGSAVRVRRESNAVCGGYAEVGF